MTLFGAAAVIFDDEGRVLLIKENYDRRRYGLPGGAVEPGESPLDGVARETFGETGLRVAVNHLTRSGMSRPDAAEFDTTGV